MIEKARILIIDDDRAILDSCSLVLSKENYATKSAENGEDGLRLFQQEAFDLVILDLKLPKIDGMDVLKSIKESNPETAIIMITGYGSIESAIQAMKLGAFDYITKPFTPEELRVVTQKAIDNRNLQLENIYLRKELETKTEFDMVIGKSEPMKKVFELIKKVSPTDTTVLIYGESGTGKELIAREIHRHSLRSNRPFVVVDCGALVETLFESELFGHEKGSFTGAIATKHGRFEIANGGTIFFDEIGNISLNIQSKLLRVIQEREVTRIGSSKVIKVDVRIIAATNTNLSEALKEGKFRDDLFYRLNVVPVNLPPLRERKEDIPLLANHFLEKYRKRAKKEVTYLSKEAVKILMEYDWPGNIRELENTLERAVVLARGNRIDVEDLLFHGIISNSSFFNTTHGMHKNLKDIEKEYIKKILISCNGNRAKASKILGIDRKTLREKIKKYGLEK